ncbi:MAG: hypothetical protein RLZZ117_1451 [Cyanobacteriota bacterium]
MTAEPHSVPLSGSPPLEASFSPFLLRDALVFILSVVLRLENTSPPRSPTSEPFSLLRQTALSLAPSFAARPGRRAAQLATLDTATPPNQPTHATEDAAQLRRIAHLEELRTALPRHGLGLARCERHITTHRLTV